MRPSLISFLRQNALVVGILAVASAATLWFGGQLLAKALYFGDPRHQDQPLEAWMTPQYVALSYKLPREVVAEALDLPEERKARRRIGEIAKASGVSLEDLTQTVRAAAAQHRSAAQ